MLQSFGCLAASVEMSCCLAALVFLLIFLRSMNRFPRLRASVLAGCEL